MMDVTNKIKEAIATLGWEEGDNVVVEFAGTATSGIDVGEDYNKKWQSPLGTVKYNKDAFIVIKNLDRNPYNPSVSLEVFNPAHPYDKA